MVTQLNAIAQLWWHWMGGMFWQVCLLILLVTAIDKAIRRWAWPQVRYVLWGLIFIKLVIPPTWQMPTSIVSWIQPMIEKRVSIQLEPRETTPVASLEMASDAHSLNPADGSDLSGRISFKSVIFLSWIAGMIAFGLILVRKIFQLRKRHRSLNAGKDPAMEIPDWFRTLLTETATRLKLRKRPAVVFSRDVVSPAVFGLFHPVLLLPEGFFNRLSREEAEHVLIHELCHLKRGDLWVHWFCLVLQMVYWFNPLLIWTRRRMRYICEICCDLSVADILREKTRYYRETLIRTARELFTETVEPGLGLLGVFEEPFRIVPRLQWLEKKTWENRKRKSAAILFTSLIMVVCVMPMAGVTQSAAQNQGDSVQNEPQPVENVYKITDVDEPPQVIHAVPPAYPFEAKAKGIEGRIVVALIVTKEGIPKDPWVVDAEPPDIFEEAALEAVRQYQFTPGRKNGEAVDVRVRLPINFVLGEQGDEYQLDPEAKDRTGIKYEMFEVDRPPRLLSVFPPKYPFAAKEEKIEGKVVVRIVVDADGRAQEPEVVMAVPYGVFEDSALEVVKLYQFEPALINGMPVACIVQIPIAYKLGPENNPPNSTPETAVSFDFNNAGIKLFINFVGGMTGNRYVIDDDVKGKLTLKSTEGMSIDELKTLLESVLDKNGLEAVPSGDYIRIRKKGL